jgi:hypothetical protein
MICGDINTMFGDISSCTRDDGHMGDHQTMPIDGRITQWSTTGGGGSRWWAEDPRHPDWQIVTCPQCGVRHIPESNRITKGGTSCFHCMFWAHRMEQYLDGELMVIEGTCYSWGATHGYGGREFTITTEDGVTTQRGLWNCGTIPWEYRAVMADNAHWGPTGAQLGDQLP